MTILQGYYDAQGSLIALVDADGDVVRRYAYDPWGRRVSPANWMVADSSNPDATYHITRGYTMHEHLDDYGLINMNGRVFDPAVAQFLSPDNYIQSDGNWLNYNRYIYCLNNPVNYTDPSGEIVAEVVILSAWAAGVINVMTHTDAIMNSDNTCLSALGYFGVGALAGAVGGIAGGAVSDALLCSGFLGGTASGAASGFSSGFINASGNAWMGGSSFGQGLCAGFEAGGIGLVSGGLIGGLSSGISAASDGYNFWDGHGQTMQMAFGPQTPNDYCLMTDEQLAQRIENEFGVKIGDYGMFEFTLDCGKQYNIVDGIYNELATGKSVAGYCVPFHNKGCSIHISPRIAGNSSNESATKSSILKLGL